MGNARTVITGMSNDNERKTVYNQPNEPYMPGQMEERMPMAPGTVAGVDNAYWGGQPEPIIEKPLAGFLVSVSRTMEGEFWPLRLGENTIGASSDCAIMLNEAKVSENHATLTIQINEEEGYQLNVWINGLNATNGTYLNRKMIPPQTAIPCSNNDKIKIGRYELILILFDAHKNEMKTAEDFAPKYDFSSGDFGGNDDFSYDIPDRPISDTKATRF